MKGTACKQKLTLARVRFSVQALSENTYRDPPGNAAAAVLHISIAKVGPLFRSLSLFLSLCGRGMENFGKHNKRDALNNIRSGQRE